MEFRRYAIYVVPHGPLYRTGAAWLGWDSAAGAAVPQPSVAGLPGPIEALTRRPRKYGLHATMKPPFRLAEGCTQAALSEALDQFCARQSTVTIPRIALRRIGRFFALVPDAPSAPLAALAASAVCDLDRFRASPSEAELSRRRARGLSPRQEALLRDWGYPYVLDAFRFHITLTGPVEDAQADRTEAALAAQFAPFLDRPLAIADLALMGEDAAGAFHVVSRHRLEGAP